MGVLDLDVLNGLSLHAVGQMERKTNLIRLSKDTLKCPETKKEIVPAKTYLWFP
jgi:hypothetical protein